MARANILNQVTATVAIAAGATNTLTATISVLRNGVIQPGIWPLEVFISASATGQGLTGVTFSGALTATTGAILTAFTATKHISAVTGPTGQLVLSLVDTAKSAGQYVCVKTPEGVSPLVLSAATVTASFG